MRLETNTELRSVTVIILLKRFLNFMICFVMLQNLNGGDNITLRSNRWEFLSELKYYEDARVHQPVEYSIIPVCLRVASRNKEYMRGVTQIGSITEIASKWIIFQEVNVQGGRCIAFLLYKTSTDGQWKVYKVEGAKCTHSVCTVADSIIEEIINSVGTTNVVDYSKYYVADGDVAYISVFRGSEIQHCAVYYPERSSRTDGKNFVSLSSLVLKLKNVVAAK